LIQYEVGGDTAWRLQLVEEHAVDVLDRHLAQKVDESNMFILIFKNHQFE